MQPHGRRQQPKGDTVQTVLGLRFLRALTEQGDDIPAWVQADRRRRRATNAEDTRRRSEDAAMHSRATMR